MHFVIMFYKYVEKKLSSYWNTNTQKEFLFLERGNFR